MRACSKERQPSLMHSSESKSNSDVGKLGAMDTTDTCPLCGDPIVDHNGEIMCSNAKCPWWKGREGRLIDFSGDGPCYVEVPSMIGVITFTFDPNCRPPHPPFHMYGPDGVEVDPGIVMRCVKHHNGFVGYDLTEYARRLGII